MLRVASSCHEIFGRRFRRALGDNPGRVSIPAPRPDDPALAVLAERVQAGDRAAEPELVERLLRGVIAIATVRLGSRDLAADAAHDTVVALIEALRAGRLREPSKVAAFVHGILVNVIRVSHRQRKVERASEPLVPELHVEIPIDRVQAGEEQQVLRAALGTLEPVDRRILIATLIDGDAPADIARRLGLSAQLVRTRKSRAVRKVAEFVRRMTRPPGKRYIRERA